MRIRVLSCFFIIFCIISALNAQTIDRFAGVGGPSGYAGDGGPARAAKIFYPYRVSSDKAGNIYVADEGNNVIRKISKAGIISTVAGNGTLGYTGDGGSATSAQLNQPTAVTVDASGNIYILDYFSSVVRKVNTAGIITTIAGNGTKGYSGDGGLATSAQLYRPVDLIVDKTGNIYISDRSNMVVRKVNTSGIISTIAGNGTSGYTGDGGAATSAQIGSPSGLAIDKSGNIFIADNYNSVIRKVTPEGVISTFAGNGTHGYSGDGMPAISAQFAISSPDGLTVDNIGNIYAADYQNQVIRKINTAGVVSTVAGIGSNAGIDGDGGPATSAHLWFPISITTDPCDNLYITDTYNNTIRKITYSAEAVVNVQPLDTIICNNANAAFTIQGNNITTYQWMVKTGSGWSNLSDNSTYAGSNTNTLLITAASASMNNYKYRCLALNPCGDSFSSMAALIVNPSIPPALTISATATTICSGTTVTFTAASVNAGNSPSYQWKKNSTVVSINSSSYTDTNLANGDLISCIVTTNNRCAANTVKSNVVAMNVSPVSTPSVTISASSNNCEGTSVSFTAVPFDGGSSPGFKWLKNGIVVGNNTAAYTDNVLKSNDVIQCILTSSNTCTTSATDTSNPIIIKVNPLLTPSVTISSSFVNICAGTTVSFTATAINGGVSPAYVWKKNGISTGTNSFVYSDPNLKNGDVVTCELTSNSNCITTNTAQSNAIAITVNPVSTPSVSITPSATNICFGTPVTFASTSMNGGVSPSYNWTKNHLSVGSNSSTYIDNNLNNGDVISCFLSSSSACATLSSVESNEVIMNVSPLTKPAITISSSKTSICANERATFIATISNGGSTLIYQWKKNGTNVGSNSGTYTDSDVLNGDVISCVLTSNNNCLAVSSVASNSITMTVFQNPVVSLNHSTTLCAASNRQLNAGNFSFYRWSDGSTGRMLSINDIGTYYVTVINDNGCVGSDTVKITSLLAAPKNFLPVDTSLCSYGSLNITSTGIFNTYTWNTTATTRTITISKAGLYWLEVTDANNCEGRDSINVLQKDCLHGFYMPTAFTPNQDGKNDFIKPSLFGNIKQYQFWIYNRFGQEVFRSSDRSKGWDGKLSGINQETNTFVWVCSYQLEDEKPETKKGTVILIR